MFKLSRLILVMIVALASAGGFWLWHGHRPASGIADDEGEMPVRAWSELTSPVDETASPYGSPEQIAVIDDRRLREVSGITASRLAPDRWWVHNDSGDLPVIYQIDATGRVVASLRVVGAINQDWEDMGSGPGADGKPALYIGDLGDNALRRQTIVVYRVNEPDQTQSSNGETEPAEAFEFRYPDGSHDAEALIIDPETGRIYIVTKSRSSDCQVFRSPWPMRKGAPMTLEPVTGKALETIRQWRLVTGAAASPDGTRLIIRTYFKAFELTRPRGASFERSFDATPVEVALPLQRQGEAIAYTLDNRSLITLSEQLPSPLSRLTRKSP